MDLIEFSYGCVGKLLCGCDKKWGKMCYRELESRDLKTDLKENNNKSSGNAVRWACYRLHTSQHVNSPFHEMHLISRQPCFCLMCQR